MCSALEVHLLAAPYVPACANISLVTTLPSWSNSYIHHTVLTSFLSTWYEHWRNPWFLSASTIGLYILKKISLFYMDYKIASGNSLCQPPWPSYLQIGQPWLCLNLQGRSRGPFLKLRSLKAMKTSMDLMAKLPRFGWFLRVNSLVDKQNAIQLVSVQIPRCLSFNPGNPNAGEIPRHNLINMSMLLLAVSPSGGSWRCQVRSQQ